MVTWASSTAGILITTLRNASGKYPEKVLAPFKSGTIAKRTAAITKVTLAAGVGWLTSKSKMTTMYKPRLATKGNERVLLGTTSNRPLQLRVKTVSQNITHNVLVIVNKEKVPDGVPHGPTINKTEPTLKHMFHEADGTTLLDNKEKVVVRIAISFGIDYEAILQTGSINQATFECLDRMDETGYLAWQIDALMNHDEALQKFLLSEANLKKYLPNSPSATGYSVVDSPFIKPEDVDDDDSDLEDDVEALGEECLSLVNAATASNNANSAPPEFVTPPNKRAAKSTSDDEDDKAAAQSEKVAQANRLSALGATYDPTSNNISLPTASTFFPSIRDATSKAAQREAITDTITSISETFNDSEHFLVRSADPPIFDRTTLAHIGKGKWSATTVDSLDADRALGLTIPQLMPDTNSTATAKKENEGIIEAEADLDEHASKRTKIGTTFTTAGEIANIGFLLSTQANILLVLTLYFAFTVTGGSAPIPSLAFYNLELAKIITSKTAKEWYKSHGNMRAEFLYYVLNQIMAITTCYAKAVKDVMVIGAISRGVPSDAPTKHYSLAHEIFKDTTQVLARVFLNSATIPNNDLFNSSSAKKKAAEKDKKRLIAELKAADSSNKNGNGGNGGNGTNDTTGKGAKRHKQSGIGNTKSGWLKCTGNNFELCQEVNNEKVRMCKSSARDGVECPFKDKCNFLHTESIMDLPKETRKPFIAHVEKTDGLEFLNTAESVLDEIRKGN